MADAGEQDRDAIDVIARRIISHEWSSEEGPGSVDYPHLTDEQWATALARADVIIDILNPREEQFLAAYEHLTGSLP